MSKGDADPASGAGNDGEGTFRLSMTRGALTIIGAAAVLIFAGVLWVAYNAGVERGARSDPMLIKAEPGAHKIKPEDPGGRQFAHQDKTVYDKLDGRDEAVEQLLPPAEEPMQKPRIIAGADPDVPNGPKIIRIPQPPSDNVPDRPEPPPAPDAPAVQNPMGGDYAPPEVAPRVADLPAPATVPAVTAVPPDTPKQEPISQPEPTRRIEELASDKQVAAPTIRAGKQFAVQLGSFRTPEAAQAGWKLLSGKHPKLLGTLQNFVSEADLGARGKFYRLQAGPFFERSEAGGTCASLKLAGVDCLVVTR